MSFNPFVFALDADAVVDTANETIKGSSWNWADVWKSVSDKLVSVAGRLLACVLILLVGHLIIKLVTIEHKRTVVPYSSGCPVIKCFTGQLPQLSGAYA